jgi:AAA domain
MDAQHKTKRITFIGGPGSGKSTTAADLFVQLKKLGQNAELIQEWIRRDLMRNGPMKTTFEQYRTLLYQTREEEKFPPDVEYIIHDGNSLLPYFYAALYADKTDPKDRLVIQDMYTRMIDDLYEHKYDFIYFLPRIHAENTGAKFEDGTRIQTPDQVNVLERYMRLIFTEIHKMDNVRVLDCDVSHRNSVLINDLLGPDMAESWNVTYGGAYY